MLLSGVNHACTVQRNNQLTNLLMDAALQRAQKKSHEGNSSAEQTFMAWFCQ
jgi:hypothetical protein